MRILSLGLGLYIVVNLVFVGYIADVILRQAYPHKDVIQLVNLHIIHFLFALLVVRFLAEKLPIVRLSCYLPLPARKSELVFSYLILFLLNGFSYVPIIVASPYWAKVILPAYDFRASILWLLGFGMLSLALSFLVLLLKMLLFSRTLVFVGVVILLAGSALLEHLGGIAFMASLSTWLFGGLLAGSPLYLAAPVGLAICLFSLTFSCLRRSLYIDHGAHSKYRQRRLVSLESVGRLGRQLTLLSLELKLITRNRVPRFQMIHGLVYVALGLILGIYISGRGTIGVVTAFISSYFCIGFMVAGSYAVTMFSWEGRFLDGLLSRNIELTRLADAKVVFLRALWLAIYLVNLILFYWMAATLRWLISALFFYVAGLFTFVLVYQALYNRRRIELNSGIWDMRTIQGRAGHILLRLFLLYCPAVLLFALNGDTLRLDRHFYLTLGLIAGPGLLSSLFVAHWRRWIGNTLRERKYDMAEAFRQR